VIFTKRDFLPMLLQKKHGYRSIADRKSKNKKMKSRAFSWRYLNKSALFQKLYFIKNMF